VGGDAVAQLFDGANGGVTLVAGDEEPGLNFGAGAGDVADLEVGGIRSYQGPGTLSWSVQDAAE
jgi:hypothetical protein